MIKPRLLLQENINKQGISKFKKLLREFALFDTKTKTKIQIKVLFHRNRLSQIPRLIDIAAAQYSYVISK